jgi:hypothetical protein
MTSRRKAQGASWTINSATFRIVKFLLRCDFMVQKEAGDMRLHPQTIGFVFAEFLCKA